MKKTINITAMLFVLIALSFSMISCNSEPAQKVDEMLGTNVKLNGTWKSQSVTYTHEGKQYTGQIELRFNDDQMQIVAPHGTSKIHRYTRNGITLNITDPYISEDNPYRTFPFALEFDSTGFSLDFSGLTFISMEDNIKIKFIKTSDNAIISESKEDEEGPVHIPTPEEFIESTPGYFVAPTEGLQKADEEIILLVSEVYKDVTEISVENVVTEYKELRIFDNPSKKGILYLQEFTEPQGKKVNGSVMIGDDTYRFDNVVFLRGASKYEIISGNIYINEEDVSYNDFDASRFISYDIDRILLIESTNIMEGVIGNYHDIDPNGEQQSKRNDYLDVIKNGRRVQINRIGVDASPTAVAVDGIFYDPDFIWRTQTDIVCCPDSTTGQFIIPEGIKRIGEASFYGCKDLTSVIIPDGVTSIGNYAFQDCSSLTSINIPDGVTSIGQGTFRDCSSLTSINIPNSVTSIGEIAFLECSSLTSINIPDSVTSIGNGAFCDCSNLTDIYVNQDESNLFANASVPYGCTIHWNSTGPESV